MTENYSVSGQIVSWCTKCKLMLDHRIVALLDEFPKKVKCNTCNGNHNYRSEAPVKKVAGTRKAKKTDYEIHMSKVEGDVVAGAKKYSLKGNFKADQIVSHVRFGIGFVLSVVERKKIDVLFEDGTKRLVQNW